MFRRIVDRFIKPWQLSKSVPAVSPAVCYLAGFKIPLAVLENLPTSFAAKFIKPHEFFTVDADSIDAAVSKVDTPPTGKPAILALQIGPGKISPPIGIAGINTLIERILSFGFDHFLIITAPAHPPSASEACQSGSDAINTVNRLWISAAQKYGIEVVDMYAKFVRWGPHKFWHTNPTVLNKAGVNAIASALWRSIAEFVIRWDLAKRSVQIDMHAGQLNLSVGKSSNPTPILSLNVIQPGPDTLQRATKQFDGKLLFKKLESGVPQPFFLPIDWTMVGPNRTWLTLFQALEMLQDLVSAYRLTKNRKFLRFALDVVFDWYAQNPPTVSRHGRGWHEGTATKRLINLVYLYNVYINSGHVDTDHTDKLIHIIVLHASLLTNEILYRPEGNHGLRQDYALIAAAVVLPENEEAETWKRCALQRIRSSQLSVICQNDGVYLEHSTDYHFMALGLYCHIIKLFFDACQMPPAFLSTSVGRMLRFGAYVIMPNGMTPSIGDSERKSTNAIYGWIKDMRQIEGGETLSNGIENLAYASSRGNQGVRPCDIDGVFQSSGWVIFRDGWDSGTNFSDTIYLNFHANLKSAKHKHADDLSFVLYGLGREWIVDPGKYNYEVNDDYRHHFAYHASAHNTFTQNGSGYDFQLGAKKSGVVMTHTKTRPPYGFATAVNRSYPTGEVARSIIFIRKPAVIIIFDHFKSNEPIEWQSYFHFAEDLVPDAEGMRVTCKAGGNVFEILRAEEDPASQEIVVGQENPILGWTSPRFGVKVPAPVLIHRRFGTDITGVTAIRIRRENQEKLKKVIYKSNEKNSTINVLLDQCDLRIERSSDGDFKLV